MSKYPPIPVRLHLQDGIVCDGTLYQKNEVIDSKMCYNIWVTFDTNLKMDDMLMRDPRVASMDIL